MSRESLYRALGEKGNPELATVVRVIQAIRLGAEVAVESQSSYERPSFFAISETVTETRL